MSNIPEKVMEIIEETVKVEGGFVNDPDDRGGATNMGVTQETYSNYIGRKATVDEIENMRISEAVEIYYQNYWQAGKVDLLPDRLQHAYFDLLVQHGPRHAGRILQQAAVNRGWLAESEVDGIVGPGTRAAVQTLTLDDLMTERAVFYSNLIFDGSSYRKRTNQTKYIRGWMNNRVFDLIRQEERQKVLAELESQGRTVEDLSRG